MGTRATITIAIALSACDRGPSPAPIEAPMAPLVVGSSPRPNPQLTARLATARALRDAALAEPTPTYAGDGSKDSHLRFAQTEVKDWYDRARPATQRALDSYRDAYAAAPTAADRAIAASESADLETTFCKRFLATSDQAEPAEWTTQPDLHQVFHNSLVSALTPFITNASATLDKCLADPTVDSPATRRCTALRTELASLAPSAAALFPRTTGTTTPPPAACACVAGDPLCSCATTTPLPRPPSRSACTCSPADPLCTCLP